jgi:zinc metalloprotease ZmpB
LTAVRIPGSTRTFTLALVAAATAAGTLALAPATNAKPPTGATTAEGWVFMVNPVQSSGDESLTDQKDAKSAVPMSAYAEVPLQNLDGSGYLRGKWAYVESATGTPAYSKKGEYFYTRDQDQFEQVMGYFWVDRAQTYLQSLGFGSTLPGIVHQPFHVKIGQYGGDNSYLTAKPYRIRLGKGGVDDGEDAEVIVHEYGHAVQQSQVPGFGQGLDAGSIGESFGDYLGVTVGLDAAHQFGWPVQAEEACPMDWDATSYTAAPHCIRRFDTGMTVATRENEVHADGQIWSQALWEIRGDYAALGKTTRAWDTTLIASQFAYAPDTSFSDAARTTYQTALARDGQAFADAVRTRFAARGITF